MHKTYRIEMNEYDLGQILDGLNVRAEAWENTAKYYRTGTIPLNFLVEESNGADEAEGIARHYRSIIQSIEKQREAQT